MRTHLSIGYLLGDITEHSEWTFIIHGTSYSLESIEWVTGYEQYAKHYAEKLGVEVSQGSAYLLGNAIPVDEDSGKSILEAVCELYGMISWVLPKNIRGHINFRGGTLYKGGRNELNIFIDRGKFYLTPLENGLARVEIRGVTKTTCYGLCTKYLSDKELEIASMRKDLN